MAFPTGPVNGQLYTTGYGSRYIYYADGNRWVKYGVQIQGETGISGIVGPSSPTGLQGETGGQGETGVQGSAGGMGPTGVPGGPGETGADGATGMPVQGATGYYGSATGILGMTFDGNGDYLVPGLQMSVKMPFNVALDSWEVVTRETGFFWSDVKGGPYSDWPGIATMNSGATGPHITDGAKNEDSDLSDWADVGVGGGDYVQFLIQGVTGIKNLTVTLGYHRT